MKKMVVTDEPLVDMKGFRPKNLDIDEKVREKLNFILKVSKERDASSVIKNWLKEKELYR